MPEEQEHMMRRFGILYQSGALWSSMTLAENVALPLQQYTKLNKQEIRAQVSLKLALVGLSGFEDVLSLGNQRRDAQSGPAWHGPWHWILKCFFLTSRQRVWTR